MMTLTAEKCKFRHIRVGTGVRLRVADVGPESGRPVILLHGYSDSWLSFMPILKFIAPNLRLIIPDQRGHGDSERPPTEYTPDDLAADALAVLDALGIPSAYVVGHSLGGFVAQRIAVAAPQRLDGLVIVASAVTADNDAVRSLGPIVQSLTDPVDVSFVRDFQLSTIHRALPPAFFEHVVVESMKLPARVWKAVLTGLLNLPRVTEPMKLECPVSLFWGDRDEIFSKADQEDLLHILQGAKLHTFNEVGHALHWEAPEEFSQQLMAVIEG